MPSNVFTLRKNQFLFFICISALLLVGCKRSANKTITMDIDTVQVKDIRISGRDHDYVSVRVQNKHGRVYEAWGRGYNDVLGGAERGDWLVIDANSENHPFGEPNIKFRVYENLTTGKVNPWYEQYIRPGIQNGKDTITPYERGSRTFVIKHR